MTLVNLQQSVLTDRSNIIVVESNFKYLIYIFNKIENMKWFKLNFGCMYTMAKILTLEAN